MNREFDVVVVGGGLAGLASACYLRRAGPKVALLDQSHRRSGRAQSESKYGFQLIRSSISDSWVSPSPGKWHS